MNNGQVKDAERHALNLFDKWNNVSGAIVKNSGWYYELQSVIEDAVHIGIQMALRGEVEIDKSGNVVKKN